MSSLLPILGSIALALSLLLTLLVAGTSNFFTARPPSGPDAMGLFAFFLVPGVIWALVLSAAFIALGHGSFDWLTRAQVVPTLIVLGVVIGLGALSTTAVIASFDRNLEWRTPIGIAGGLVLPLLAQAFLVALLWVPPPAISQAIWPRVGGGTLALLALVAWVGAGVLYVSSERAKARRAYEAACESERQQVQWKEEEKQREAQSDAALAAMPDDAPLREFLPHLFINHTEAHHRRAVERISGLPNIRQRVEEGLADAVPIQREYCANYIRMCPAPDPALAPAVAHAMELLAEDLRHGASNGGLSHARGMTLGLLMTAQRFPGAPFDASLKELRSAMEAWPDESTRAEALADIDKYVKGEPLRP